MNSIVISSRVRLARNISDFPFPEKSSHPEEIIQAVRKAAGQTFQCLECDTMPALDKQELVEEHLISPGLANRKSSAVLFNKEQTVSIMVNEEDHLRIQCILPGLQLQEAFTLADQTDDLLEQHLNFAFDETVGYLTACPTNVGTGMRASVMLHLPALTAHHQMNNLIASAGKMGFAVRGMYGEGSKAEGDIYQISNQITLGLSEAETLQRLQSVTEQLIEREQQIRQAMMERDRAKMCDTIWRAFGIIKYAQVMTTSEFMSLASQIRLGISTGVIQHIKPETLNRLMTEIQPAHLQKRYGKVLSPAERDLVRAEYLRKEIERKDVS